MGYSFNRTLYFFLTLCAYVCVCVCVCVSVWETILCPWVVTFFFFGFQVIVLNHNLRPAPQVLTLPQVQARSGWLEKGMNWNGPKTKSINKSIIQKKRKKKRSLYNLHMHRPNRIALCYGLYQKCPLSNYCSACYSVEGTLRKRSFAPFKSGMINTRM